ncbi:hypothetical protein CALCODRAFT_502747 [Calocera cornea HHB12733]|uniref:Uncharacterized protein n=1 Tax=Calocera cornea HHB12733 TaxID=1353952 RepID=A0A165D4W0_9BASI|nr:hypothetical protein CALCODRAFT_502747 [Calocera cornea HHB12733]
MHTRTNRRYEVRSMDAGCYVRSRLWLERALLVNFVVMCGTALRETEQSIPWLVDKYKKMYKKDNPSTAFFTTDIYHTLAVHASWLKDYWVRAKWRNAEYEKRVGVPVPEWDRFSRKVEEKKAKAAREGRSWGRKREVGAGEGKSPGKRKRAAPPASQTRGEGSAKKRRVDVRKTPAEASTSPETARMEPADLFRRPHVAGPSPARTPGMSAAESASARRTGSRARRTVEEIDLSGSVATTRRVSTRRKSSASRRRAPSAPSEEADLDLTMADSDDPDPGEEDELFGSSPAPPVRGPRAPPPMEMDEQSASGSEAEVEGLFTPPPERGRRGRSLEAEQKKARGGWGDDEDPWTTPVHAVQPWVPRETYKPRALPEKGAEMPACFTHRPVLSPSYAWRCPLPSCTYTIDFLRPSAAFRDSLKKEEVLIARAKHASHTGSRLNGLFYECVMKHYRVHLGEMKVQWPVKLGK